VWGTWQGCVCGRKSKPYNFKVGHPLALNLCVYILYIYTLYTHVLNVYTIKDQLDMPNCSQQWPFFPTPTWCFKETSRFHKYSVLQWKLQRQSLIDAR
jgi:hypothetical protein